MAVRELARVVGQASLARLVERITDRSALIGIVGLGDVGLALAVEFAQQFGVIGFDTDPRKVAKIEDKVKDGAIGGTTDFSWLLDCDAIIICVPAPLETSESPDLSYLEGVATVIAKLLRPGQLVVLESTTYPGTTEELLLPLFQTGGLELDKDFLLAFSPQRIHPDNKRFRLVDIPKVVGGCSQASTDAASLLYGSIMQRVHPVSTARAAEAVKLLENSFRLVNTGLANEMAMFCYQHGMDANEVIEAAATKPFEFMPFYPAPDVTRHCVLLDPARVLQLAERALNDRGKAMRGSRILLVGVAIPILDHFRAQGAKVAYHDPLVPYLGIDLREWPQSKSRSVPNVVQRRRRSDYSKERRTNNGSASYHAAQLERRSGGSESHARRRDDGLRSVELTDKALARADCVVIVTAPAGVDYDLIARAADIIIDTRNALSKKQRRSATGIVVGL